MSISGFLGWLNIRGIECDLTLSDEIYNQCPTLVIIGITNKKRFFHSYLLTVKVLEQSRLITSVPLGGTASTSFIHTFLRRGEHCVNQLQISSTFPVNFFNRGVNVPVRYDFTVFPNPKGIGIDPFNSSSHADGELLLNKRGSDGEMTTIADYTGVEPIKQIHWRLSARHDWFKIKELGTTANEPIILDLTVKSSMLLEEKLSRAAALINKSGRLNRGIGLKVREDALIQPGTGRNHRLRLLKELALFS